MMTRKSDEPVRPCAAASPPAAPAASSRRGTARRPPQGRGPSTSTRSPPAAFQRRQEAFCFLLNLTHGVFGKRLHGPRKRPVPQEAVLAPEAATTRTSPRASWRACRCARSAQSAVDGVPPTTDSGLLHVGRFGPPYSNDAKSISGNRAAGRLGLPMPYRSPSVYGGVNLGAALCDLMLHQPSTPSADNTALAEPRCRYANPGTIAHFRT